MRHLLALLFSLGLTFYHSDDLKELHKKVRNLLIEKIESGPEPYSKRAKMLTGKSLEWTSNSN